jgi:hypothetical protein
MKKKCPKCGSAKTVEIIYGSPKAETLQRYLKGEVIMGGCVLAERVPNYHCQECSFEFMAPD